jgi:hypothetical protein
MIALVHHRLFGRRISSARQIPRRESLNRAVRYNRFRRCLEKLADNGLAGCVHFVRLSHSIDAAPGGPSVL